jgi:uncharacterized protein involved in exopolysaccharide biosynthesis
VPDDHPLPAPISYAEAIRRHPRVLLGIAAAALLVGMLWVLVRSPDYEASAKVLVAPVAAEDRAFVGLPVLRETGDATRTVQTAAGLLESPAAASAAATALGPDRTGPQVEASVSIEAQGESSLIAVTGRGGSPEEAARVANAYANASIRLRDGIVGAQIERRIAELDVRLAALPTGSPAATDTADRREALAAVGKGDPSMSLVQVAVPPTAATGPPGWLLLALVLAVGLGVGAATALALEALERRRPGTRERTPAATRRVAGAAPPDDATLLDTLRRAMADRGPNLTRDAFERWRREQPSGNGRPGAVPSSAVIARRFGGWSAARDRARREPGDLPDRSLQDPRASRPQAPGPTD